jgi:hypothetical protein
MRFREDILRGVRLGGILFALLLVGVATYRVLRESPAPDPQPEKQEAPRQASSSDPPIGPSLVPPPPPLVVHKHPANKQADAKSAVAESIPTPVADAPTGDENPPAATVTEEEKKGPDSTAEKAEAESGPTVGVEHQKSENRSKRWIRAVGRFLHISPKKDVPGEAVRQP